MTSNNLPSEMRYLAVKTQGTDFRECVEIRKRPLPEVTPTSALIKNKLLGVNASLPNVTAGVFFRSDSGEQRLGSDAVGQVVDVGDDSRFKIGQWVVYVSLSQDSYGEYSLVENADLAAAVPSPDPAYLTLFASGTTASIALEEEGALKGGCKALISTAAGGTGHIAAQLAKQAGCHVVATCSTPEKEVFLRQLGCDRVINYREEAVEDVLDQEYPSSLDLVYECVGKPIFEPALKNLAPRGRLLVIGQISTYDQAGLGLREQSEVECKHPIAISLLLKSASVRGFLLSHFLDRVLPHFEQLSLLYERGSLKVVSTKGENCQTGPFMGLGKVADAVEFMYSRQNIGKIYVEL